MTSPVEIRGEPRFRLLFERAPVAIWDEDFSGVKDFLDDLFFSGVIDIRRHLQSNPDLVGDAIRRVQVRHVNRIAREFYGADSEEDLIRALPSLFDATALQVFTDEIVALAEGATTFTAELLAITLTGERRLVQMNVSLLLAEADDWSQVVVTFTDLTERKRLEQSLELANEKLRRVNADLEQFAFAAAHDLTEPLRTISLYAQLLQKFQTERLGPAADTALASILQNTSRMRTLVGDLLTYAQMAEPADLSRCPGVDANTIAREVLLGIAGAIEEAGASVDVSCALPAVAIQAGHLRQLLQNLLVNAIKYRSPDRAVEVRLTASQSSGEAVFCVSDNGIGIGPDYQNRIFGIFNRLHGIEIEGSGIGLALCKKIIEQYNGRLWVESEEGSGSKFYFAIPSPAYIQPR
ncbi:MAG: ATP-binding protein [Bryobacteraceae bacterium]